MPSPDLTDGVAKVTQAAQTELADHFSRLVSPDAKAVQDALTEVLPGLVDKYGSAAASLAAEWYENERGLAGVPGTFPALLADLPGEARTDALAGWATGPLFSAEPDRATALTKLNGGLQRIVANAARQTVMKSSVHDPRARGWRRVGKGANCDFCNLLIHRGGVYTDLSAKFKSHDHCNCGAEPEWDASRGTVYTPPVAPSPAVAAAGGPPPGLELLDTPEILDAFRRAEAARKAMPGKYDAKGNANKKYGWTYDTTLAHQTYTNSPVLMNLLLRDPVAFAKSEHMSVASAVAKRNKALADLIAKNELPDDVTVARGVMDSDYSHLKAGDHIADPGFMSTSTNPQEATYFATKRARGADAPRVDTLEDYDKLRNAAKNPEGWRIVMKAPKGSHAVAGVEHQNEVIFPPGTKQVVAYVDHDAKVLYTELEA